MFDHLKLSLGLQFLLEHIEALIMYSEIQEKISKDSEWNIALNHGPHLF